MAHVSVSSGAWWRGAAIRGGGGLARWLRGWFEPRTVVLPVAVMAAGFESAPILFFGSGSGRPVLGRGCRQAWWRRASTAARHGGGAGGCVGSLVWWWPTTEHSGRHGVATVLVGSAAVWCGATAWWRRRVLEMAARTTVQIGGGAAMARLGWSSWRAASVRATSGLVW